jgi:hypothetical protein
VWNYTTPPLIHLYDVVLNEAMDVFMAWYLVKYKDNFTFTTFSGDIGIT